MLLTSFLQYILKFVVFSAAALAGIFLGKSLRGRKDAKEAGQTQKEK